MSRSLTAAVIAQTTTATVSLAFFAELAFDSATVRVWTGIGDKTWDSQTWTGLGSFGGIGDIDETTQISPRSANLVLSGIPSSLISLALTEKYQGRSAEIWQSFINISTGAIIADPVSIFSGRMGVMSIATGLETGTLTLSVESHLVNLSRASNRRYTRESQRRYFTSDTAFDHVPTIQLLNIPWGIPS